MNKAKNAHGKVNHLQTMPATL